MSVATLFHKLPLKVKKQWSVCGENQIDSHQEVCAVQEQQQFAMENSFHNFSIQKN